MSHEISPPAPDSDAPHARGPEADRLARRLFLRWHEMERIDELSPPELDALPFGAIRLDHHGRIVMYNAMESQLSGREPAAVLGKNFFTEVAPCTNVREFAGRFRAGVDAGTLNEVFPYTFAFPDQTMKVWIRLYLSAHTLTCWVFVTRRSDTHLFL